MRNLIIAVALVATTSIGGAMAQTTAPSGSTTTPSATTTTPSMNVKTRAECETDWKTADKNQDGRLDKAEMDAAKSMMPSTLASSATVSMQEFVTACSTKG
jgi:hypothetical protein